MPDLKTEKKMVSETRPGETSYQKAIRGVRYRIEALGRRHDPSRALPRGDDR